MEPQAANKQREILVWIARRASRVKITSMNVQRLGRVTGGRGENDLSLSESRHPLPVVSVEFKDSAD
jgi:hypothetical protein